MSNILIIGGGFFGLYLADYFANRKHIVHLIESENQFMSRASYANQARIHNGYHYPRSVLTALRSKISFPRFINEFHDCVCSDFEKYYMIGKLLGKVTSKQFLKFFERIGAACIPSNGHIKSLTNPNLIDDCFSVTEYAFDSILLKNIMLKRISSTNATFHLNTQPISIKPYKNGLGVLLYNNNFNETHEIFANHVFNCTYTHLNHINHKFGTPFIPLKHELTEMCIVDVPEVLKKIGITVMCGPFFSLMPFPSLKMHSLSHVRYTPHDEWNDTAQSNYYNYKHYCKDEINILYNSSWDYMQKDASRYIPILNDLKYKSSIWEIKTILPRSEADDSRPILFLPNHGLNGFHCILGGKIDNVYDVIEHIELQNILN